MERGLHARDGLPTGFVSQAQSDGRKWLAHLTTGTVATVLSLLLAAFLGTGPAGPKGPPGTEVVVNKTAQVGICAYFGPDSTGRLRFQVSAPTVDAAGPWCQKGKYISLVPVKK